MSIKHRHFWVFLSLAFVLWGCSNEPASNAQRDIVDGGPVDAESDVDGDEQDGDQYVDAGDSDEDAEGGDTPDHQDPNLIFSADFDDQADWSPQIASQRYRFEGDDAYTTDEPIELPGKFDFFYTSERWHPLDHPDREPVAQISDFQSRTPGGKSFTIFDESYGAPSQWGADAVLTTDLGAEYDELWIETWIKFQPDWIWADELNGSGQSTMKYLRCRRHTGDTTNSRFSFFGEDGRSGTPVGILDLKSWTTDNGNYVRPLVALRGYTDAADFDTEDDYYDFFGDYTTRVESAVTQGGEDSLAWEDVFYDGEWHQISYYLKMDSAPGAGDGQTEIWINGVLETSAYDIPWRRAEDPEDIGWNECSLGGNMHNIPHPEDERFEQWYSVDEFKIYSQRPEGLSD